MTKNKSYSEALKALENLVKEIENGELEVDVLAKKIKEATELVNFCRKELRTIESKINTSLDELED